MLKDLTLFLYETLHLFLSNNKYSMLVSPFYNRRTSPKYTWAPSIFQWAMPPLDWTSTGSSDSRMLWRRDELLNIWTVG